MRRGIITMQQNLFYDLCKIIHLVESLSIPLLLLIEEGRAPSRSPHKKFGYFLSISQQGVSSDSIQNSTVGNTNL
jgi:hypothetical protein